MVFHPKSRTTKRTKVDSKPIISPFYSQNQHPPAAGPATSSPRAATPPKTPLSKASKLTTSTPKPTPTKHQGNEDPHTPPPTSSISKKAQRRQDKSNLAAVAAASRKEVTTNLLKGTGRPAEAVEASGSSWYSPRTPQPDVEAEANRNSPAPGPRPEADRGSPSPTPQSRPTTWPGLGKRPIREAEAEVDDHSSPPTPQSGPTERSLGKRPIGEAETDTRSPPPTLQPSADQRCPSPAPQPRPTESSQGKKPKTRYNRVDHYDESSHETFLSTIRQENERPPGRFDDAGEGPVDHSPATRDYEAQRRSCSPSKAEHRAERGNSKKSKKH